MKDFKETAAGFGAWLKTAKLLRRNKRTEYLSPGPLVERRNTQMLLGALLEFARSSGIAYDETVKFLQDRNVDVNVGPDFQWEQKCLQGPRVVEFMEVEEAIDAGV